MTEGEQALIEQVRAMAHQLYMAEGAEHYSCGTALAVSFGRNVRPYLALRRGGLTGEGACGAKRAGEMVLCELLGHDDEGAGPLNPELQAAIEDLRKLCDERLAPDQQGLICNELLAPYAFSSPERKSYCGSLVSAIAALVAEVALRHGAALELPRPEA